MKAFLNQSCDMGPNRTSCFQLWSNLQHISNTSTEAVSYNVSYLKFKDDNFQL